MSKRKKREKDSDNTKDAILSHARELGFTEPHYSVEVCRFEWPLHEAILILMGIDPRYDWLLRQKEGSGDPHAVAVGTEFRRICEHALYAIEEGRGFSIASGQPPIPKTGDLPPEQQLARSRHRWPRLKQTPSLQQFLTDGEPNPLVHLWGFLFWCEVTPDVPTPGPEFKDASLATRGGSKRIDWESEVAEHFWNLEKTALLAARAVPTPWTMEALRCIANSSPIPRPPLCEFGLSLPRYLLPKGEPNGHEIPEYEYRFHLFSAPDLYPRICDAVRGEQIPSIERDGQRFVRPQDIARWLVSFDSTGSGIAVVFDSQIRIPPHLEKLAQEPEAVPPEPPSDNAPSPEPFTKQESLVLEAIREMPKPRTAKQIIRHLKGEEGAPKHVSQITSQIIPHLRKKGVIIKNDRDGQGYYRVELPKR